MRLDIQGTATAGLPTVRRHAEQRALFELARYGECIQTVRLRVTERPATSEHRYHCGIAVTVLHDDGTSGHVLARAEGDDVFRLIDTRARAGVFAGRGRDRTGARCPRGARPVERAGGRGRSEGIVNPYAMLAQAGHEAHRRFLEELQHWHDEMVMHQRFVRRLRPVRLFGRLSARRGAAAVEGGQGAARLGGGRSDVPPRLRGRAVGRAARAARAMRA